MIPLKETIQGLDQLDHIFKEVITDRLVFHITPEPFYQIQIRTISRQPNYSQPFSVLPNEITNYFRIVNLEIIQNEVNLPTTVLSQQMLQEFQKLDRTLPSKNQISNPPSFSIQRPENMYLIILACPGHLIRLAFPMPNSSQ
jgi:hypothetical protein